MVQYSLIVLLVAFYGAHGSGYEKYNLVSSEICYERRNALLSQLSFLDTNKVWYMPDFDTGAIYGQSWNSSSFKRYSECKFTLQARTGHGIFLVVRKMHMRQDPKGNCLDTVSVRQSNNKKTKFCYTPKDVPRSFSDSSFLKISIKLDHSMPLPSPEDTLYIQLVATQKRDCTGSKDELQCGSAERQSCIHKSFANDGTINCPNCIDEPSCEQEPVEILSVSSNKEKVVLTAFVSLILTALGFCALFLCLYKSKQWMLMCNCGAGSDRERVNRTGRGHLQRHGRGEGNVVAGVHSIELRGSASDLAPTAPLEEKDLPPSYDALFPTTTVACSTSGPVTVSAATSPTIPKAGMERDEDLTK
uniref:CUB domain-containing protein n=1 Tax=Anopheles epiroticus TaxID=199890 RepID=A0A182P8V3_9DIPT